MKKIIILLLCVLLTLPLFACGTAGTGGAPTEEPNTENPVPETDNVRKRSRITTKSKIY